MADSGAGEELRAAGNVGRRRSVSRTPDPTSDVYVAEWEEAEHLPVNMEKTGPELTPNYLLGTRSASPFHCFSAALSACQ